MLREDAEREARAVVAVRPFGDADESLLAGGQMYRLEKPDQISARLEVTYTGFSNINNQRFGLKFVEEVANPSGIELRWLTKSYIFYISGK